MNHSASTSWTVRALAGALLLTAGVTACGGSDSDGRGTSASPAPSTSSSTASPSPSPSTPSSSTASATSTSTAGSDGLVATGTSDPVAGETLTARAAQEGAVVSTTPATAGSPDLGALARTSGGTDTTVELVTSVDGQWRTEAVLTAPEPLLDSRSGGAIEWRHVTGTDYPDAVVYLQGGTLTGGVDAAVATRDGGTWHWVPRQVADESDGNPILLGNPVFDAGPVFATRASASGEVAARYWRYDGAAGSFAVTQRPS